MDYSDQAHVWERPVHKQARFEEAQVRVAVLALPQASLASIATVVEDLEAVSLLPDAPGAAVRFAPRVVGRSDPEPAMKLPVSFIAGSPEAEWR